MFKILSDIFELKTILSDTLPEQLGKALSIFRLQW